MDHTWIEENDIARQRLCALTASLSDEGLESRLKNGWTIASALVHLAFWDQYYIALLTAWERTGFTPVSINADAVNAAVHALSLCVSPRKAVQLAQTSADTIDRKLAGISPDLAAAIENSGHVRILRRAMHRNEHLPQIEEVVRCRHHRR